MIVVSGIHRTGTTVMMQVLSTSSALFPVVGWNTPADDSDGPWGLMASESNYVYRGMTKDDPAFPPNACVKLIYQGMVLTDQLQLDRIRVIFMMVRDWREQTLSYNKIIQQKVERTYPKLPDPKPDVATVVREGTMPPGTHFVMSYGALLQDMMKRGYGGKVIPVRYSDLVNEPQAVVDRLEKILGVTLSTSPVKKETCDFNGQTPTFPKENELAPGFYAFCDRLSEALQDGKVTTDLVKCLEVWTPIIHKRVGEQGERFQARYQFRP